MLEKSRKTLPLVYHKVHTFVEAVQSADDRQKKVALYFDKFSHFSSSFDTIKTILTKKIVAMSDKIWKGLLSLSEFNQLNLSYKETKNSKVKN